MGFVAGVLGKKRDLGLAGGGFPFHTSGRFVGSSGDTGGKLQKEWSRTWSGFREVGTAGRIKVEGEG